MVKVYSLSLVQTNQTVVIICLYEFKQTKQIGNNWKIAMKSMLQRKQITFRHHLVVQPLAIVDEHYRLYIWDFNVELFFFSLSHQPPLPVWQQLSITGNPTPAITPAAEKHNVSLLTSRMSAGDSINQWKHSVGGIAAAWLTLTGSDFYLLLGVCMFISRWRIFRFLPPHKPGTVNEIFWHEWLLKVVKVTRSFEMLGQVT